MELNVGQRLFEAIQAVTGHTPLESEMQQILSAVEEDNNLKNIDALHSVSDSEPCPFCGSDDTTGDYCNTCDCNF